MIGEKELRYYLNLTSFSVILIAILAFLYLRDFPVRPFVNLFLAAGFLTVILNFSIYIFLRKRPEVAFWVSTLLFDVVVAVMSLATGGIESRLPYLLVIPVAFAVYFQGVISGVIQSILSLIIVLGLSQSQHGFLNPEFHFYPSPLVKNLSYVLLYALIFGFFTALTAYFSGIIRRQAKDFLLYRLSSEEILNSVPSGIMTISSSGEVLFMNRSAREILNFEEAGKFLGEVLKVRGVVRSEVKINSKIIGFSQKILENGTRMVVFQDLTDYKKLEDEKKELEKLAFIGELAGNLAHEIRNPVQAISMAMELLISGRVNPDPEFLRSIMIDTEKLSQVVNRFLYYSKIPELRFESINPRGIIEDVFLNELKSVGREVVLENNVPEELKLQGDSSRIAELFGNLIRNSIEAKATKISVYWIKKGESFQLVDGSKIDAENNILVLRDNGEGMDEETLKKAKELFFTTKPSGTGFGLAICDRIVKAHGWDLSIYSVKGNGTDVVIEVKGHGI